MSTQLVITLYIRPTQGPISSMQLDMLEVETAVQNLPHTHNRDDSRIHEIAERIKKQFPNVDPHSRMYDFSHLISRIHQIYLFDGVVLNLPGTIAGEDTAPSPPTSKVDEFKHLNEEVSRYRDGWAELEHKYDTEFALARRLERDNDNLSAIHRRQHDEISALRTLQEKTEEQLDNVSIQIKKSQDEADQLERENAQMQTQLELVKRDRQSALAAQQELADLRPELTRLRKDEQQLREVLRLREKEIVEVRERLRRLTEGVTTNKVDEGKEPWLDT